MTLTVKEICGRFWAIEQKYEANHMEIQGTYPWQLIRVYLYYEIARKLNVFESAQQATITKSEKIKSLTPFVKNSLLYDPSSGKEKEILIFDHPRKVMFQGEYQDIYSYFLPKVFDKFNYSYELIESPYLNKHYTNRRKKKDKNGKRYIKYNDKILLESYVHKTKNRNKVPFTKEELEKIAALEQAIENSFSDIETSTIITVDLLRIIEDHILNFQYEYEKYCEIFDKKKPKQIYVVVAYENKAVVAAAKSKGIEVIELQHGTISPYHLGYSYPKQTMLKNGKVAEIEYFPDKILTFGDYWQNASLYPIESDNLITLGFPYFEENAKEYKLNNYKPKNKKQILFISQGVIGKYLSKFAYEIALELSGKKDIGKLITPEEKNEKDEAKIEAEKLKKSRIFINQAIQKASISNEDYEVEDIIEEVKEETLKEIEFRKQLELQKEEEYYDSLEKYEIIYKLHPGEYETWEENYPYLKQALELNERENLVRFKVIDNNNTPLYKLFAESEYQIGAFSTAIYEGLSFNCKTFIIDVPGTEYLDDLIKAEIVKKTDNVHEVIDIIKNKNQNIFTRRLNESFFFKNFDESVIMRLLK